MRSTLGHAPSSASSAASVFLSLGPLGPCSIQLPPLLGPCSVLPRRYVHLLRFQGRLPSVGSLREYGQEAEAEDIKKRWQEYTEELYKKDLHEPDNHDGVITHLEPDILECEVKLPPYEVAFFLSQSSCPSHRQQLRLVVKFIVQSSCPSHRQQLRLVVKFIVQSSFYCPLGKAFK
ncbi:hypothetical protein AB1E18_015831 [Capra hircus]